MDRDWLKQAVAIMITLLLLSSGTQASSEDNEVPTVIVGDQDLWLGSTVTSGFTVVVEACDPDGVVTQIALEVPGIAGRIEEPRNSGCATLFRNLTHGHPGDFTALGEATDDHGDTTEAEGNLRVELNPFDVASVPGYPPLGEIPLTDLGGVMTIDTRVSDTGEVRGARISSDGKVVFDTMADVPPEQGDEITSVAFNLLFGSAEFRASGQTLWTGFIAQTGGKWWQIEPVEIISTDH